MVYAEFGGQTECIMGNSKIENGRYKMELSSKTGKQYLCLLTRMVAITMLIVI